MCLAKAFIINSSKQPIFEDIARLRVLGDRVEMETLFGEEKVVPGRVVEIDFSNSSILLDEYRENDDSLKEREQRQRNTVAWKQTQE
ncbi:MAG: CooT family nickel-binding protein [Chloroflexi bacterium]|nr:CooT family nickel-binding protein [Chloroflexota bacterium]